MKKTLLAFTLSSLFIAGAVQAEDHSETIDISGSVSGANDDCFISFTTSNTVTNNSADTIIANLHSKISGLPTQGQNATDPNWIDYRVNGCDSPVAVVLHGTPDDADGTTLANSDNSEASAKGVGIGLFDEKFAPLNINSSHLALNSKGYGQFNLQLVKLNGQTPVEGVVHGSLTIDIVQL